MLTFHEISAYFGSAVQACASPETPSSHCSLSSAPNFSGSAAVDDKVAVYLASMKMARAVPPTIVADNEEASIACNRSDCICMMSRPRPWTDSTDSVGLNLTLEEREESGSSYDEEDDGDDEHDYSASLRPVNKAWSPTEELSVRCTSRPQTFHTAQEQIPAFWMQILPTPQPTIHEESVEGESDFNVPTSIAIPFRSKRADQKPNDLKVLNDIHDPQKMQIRDLELASVTVPLEDMTTAMFTATENPKSPYTEAGDQSRRSKSSLWKRLQTQVRTKKRTLDTAPLQSGWRIKIRFLAGRLLRRGA